MKKLYAPIGVLLLALLFSLFSTPASASTPVDYPGDRAFWFEDDGVHFAAPLAAHQEINTNLGSIHLDPNNGHLGAQYIGQTFVPYSALGFTTGCITWGQYGGAPNYHFGEDNSGRGGVDERGWEFCIGVTPPVEEPPIEEPPGEEEPPAFVPYEVCMWWIVIDTDGNGDIWEQRVLSRNCDFVPPAECEAYTLQFDKYWIRDAEDKLKYETIEVLYSPADDASLEPHDYFVEEIEAKDCPPPPPPIVPEVPVTTSLAATGIDGAQTFWVVVAILGGLSLIAFGTYGILRPHLTPGPRRNDSSI